VSHTNSLTAPAPGTRAGAVQTRPSQPARPPAKRLSTISVSNAAVAGKVLSAGVKMFKKIPGKDEYVRKLIFVFVFVYC
jgi:hypothetical protein